MTSMISQARTAVKHAIRVATGYDLVRPETNDVLYNRTDHDFVDIYESVRPLTMTTRERIYALYSAVKYVIESGLAGDLVECGVWRGGSAMAMAMALLCCERRDRKIFLYDTFTGMSMPTENDTKFDGSVIPMKKWQEKSTSTHTDWCYCPLEEVRRNILSTGYPEENVVFVKGKVEETIPETIPAQISLLRLDTDFYESTYHELVHLYPRLQIGGVLILDDYGSWRGAKEAVDKYFEERQIRLLLQRIDHSGRIAVKTS